MSLKFNFFCSDIWDNIIFVCNKLQKITILLFKAVLKKFSKFFSFLYKLQFSLRKLQQAWIFYKIYKGYISIQIFSNIDGYAAVEYKSDIDR